MSDFELDKAGDSLHVEMHQDEIHVGGEGPYGYDEGFGHGCVTGMWLTRDEAAQLRDCLTRWLEN